MARQKLIHLHTSDNRAPSASVLNYGEIAVMHNEQNPALFIKVGEEGSEEVVKFVDEKQVKGLISGATREFVALKTEISALTETMGGADEALQGSIDALSGSLETLEGNALTGAVVNNVTGTVEDNVVSVEIDTDDIKLGTDVAYGSETLASTSANATTAIQALANKINSIDTTVSQSNHGHENKALLDTYTQTEADLADAVAKKHEHANASVLDGISAEDVEAWDGAVDALDDKVDKIEGKGLSTEDYTTAEKEKLATIAASAQTNVIESVKVNGTALTVTDKAVDILVAEGTANGTVKVNGVDINVHGLGSAAFQDASAFDESGAAETAKTELIGDMTGATKTLGGLEDRIDALTTGSNVSISTATTTEGYLKSYTFSQNGSEIGKIDIPKDLVVTSGQIVEENGAKYLRLTIANQSTPVDIAVADLVDVYTQGNGIEISTGNVISAKVVAGNGLSLDANGIAMAAASSAGAGAMSAADFDKLAGLASGAQVNVLEGVQVNGADLTPDANKKVNVTITAGTNNGTIAVNGSDVAVTGLGSAAFEDASAFDAAGDAEAARVAAVDSAVTAVVGDMTGDTKTLGALQDAIEGLHLGEDNVLEGVQVNGTDLTIANKKVNVTVAEGATDGTIAVNGSDVAVHGLGSAAYENATAFDEAGAAAAASAAAVTTVVGTAQDNSGATTVYGAKAYADEKASEAQAAAEAAVVGTAQDNSGATTVYGAKAYADQVAANAVANAVTGATGDTLVSASVTNNEVVVEATQALSDAVAAANASVQGIATGKDSGAALDSDRKLDFTEFGIDCGTY